MPPVGGWGSSNNNITSSKPADYTTTLFVFSTGFYFFSKYTHTFF